MYNFGTKGGIIALHHMRRHRMGKRDINKLTNFFTGKKSRNDMPGEKKLSAPEKGGEW